MKTNKIILRRLNDDSEGDKYQYYLGCTDGGVELTTPFRNNALVITEGQPTKVVSRDWKIIKVKTQTP